MQLDPTGFEQLDERRQSLEDRELSKRERIRRHACSGQRSFQLTLLRLTELAPSLGHTQLQGVTTTNPPLQRQGCIEFEQSTVVNDSDAIHDTLGLVHVVCGEDDRLTTLSREFDDV